MSPKAIPRMESPAASRSVIAAAVSGVSDVGGPRLCPVEACVITIGFDTTRPPKSAPPACHRRNRRALRLR